VSSILESYYDHFVYLSFLAIGLQFGFRTLLWLSAVPPIFLIIAFKIYINRTYLTAFKYFTPTEEEIRVARVYSMQKDAQNNSLEKRFGHPALHTELFTPMLHKNMMPLLSEVYHGKINNDLAKLDEYGGQRMEAQVVPGGIKIAAIDQVCSNFFDTTFVLTNVSFSIVYRMILCMTPLRTSVTGVNLTGTNGP
jgi:hypothetical protein